MHGHHRAFGHHIEIGIGNDHGDFDDVVAVGIKPGHLHIQPDEVVLVLCHI